MKQFSKRVLITGAAGRVARRLCPLIEERHEIFRTDIRSRSDEQISALNVLDQDAVTAAVRGMDAIFHCAIASYDSAGASGTRTEKELRHYHESILEVNLKGAYHIYEAARLAGVARVIYVSSMTVVLGDGSDNLDPAKAPCPFDFYAVSKLFGEHVGALYARKHGIRTTVLRLGQPFPIGWPDEELWLKNASSRSILVPHQVIAEAALDALAEENPPGFQIKHVVGGIDNPELFEPARVPTAGVNGS